MSPFNGPPIEIAKYTDAELTERLDVLGQNIAECESFEHWKPTLVAEKEWIKWELDRREKADQP